MQIISEFDSDVNKLIDLASILKVKIMAETNLIVVFSSCLHSVLFQNKRRREKPAEKKREAIDDDCTQFTAIKYTVNHPNCNIVA